RVTLAREPMSGAQVAAVVICILLTALDGFDVLSISFAAPGIAAEWGIDRGALGIVLSMELIGMAVGSVVIGGLADRIGRRPAILGCLTVMALGMYLASTAPDITILSIYRFATGLGIGGMLASTNAMAAEFSNAKRRNLSVILMAAGYPIGVIVGGSVASILLVYFDWRSVFLFGTIATAAFIPLTWYLLPESIEHLIHRRPRGALERVNATLQRMGHAAIEALPPAEKEAPSSGMRALFSPELARTTILLTFAYFTHIMTFYFTLKWIPKIVVDMGFAPALAGGVLVWANVGGVTGSVLLGLLAQRYAVRGLIIATLILGAGAVVWFGQGQADLAELALVAACVGFFTNAAVVGLYALFAQSFPTALRAGGTGFAIGVGRGGSASGPIIAGFLFAAGASLPSVACIMALGSVVAAASLLALGAGHTRPVTST
ncbi:MAG: MFS transporter, partial [Sedimentisphaerales bacterium]|nr:MFS transporter [Sedimentisphaerales bacterium]